ncbi:hypothetical protein ACJJTC_012280 [Scirpophaga incertulas]
MTDRGSDSLVVTKNRLKELTIKRSSIKGQITKFKNYLSLISAKQQLNSVELAELNLKVSRFESLSNKFEEIQCEIEVLNDNNLDSELDEREDIEQEIIFQTATAKQFLEKTTENANQSQCSHDHQELVKLQAIYPGLHLIYSM